jgi:hypothetical protein
MSAMVEGINGVFVFDRGEWVDRTQYPASSVLALATGLIQACTMDIKKQSVLIKATYRNGAVTNGDAGSSFFSFSDPKRRVIDERRSPALEIALALSDGVTGIQIHPLEPIPGVLKVTAIL